MIKNNLAETIPFYIERGYTLFPLNGKHPPKGCHWRESEFNPFASPADFPSGNFGVCLRPDDLVIDVDPRNFKNGQDSLVDLFEYLGIITIESLRVMTGSGGLHIYLKKSPDWPIRKALKEFPGLDFLSDGQYVVGAGSIHPEAKKPYIGHFCPVLMAPEGLLELLKKQKQSLTVKGVEHYDSSGQTRERFREYLNHAPLAIEGESGDQTTFAVAAVGHDFGLSPDDTFTAMLDEYNPRCQPPWGAEALQTKVQNAYKYAASPIGGNNPTTQFDEVQVEILKDIDPKKKLFHRDSHGELKKDLHNAALFFGKDMPLDNLLAFNEFTRNIEYLKLAPWHRSFENERIWNDGEALRAKFWLSHAFKFEPSTPVMHEAAFVAATMRPYHPVKEYLAGLRWDGHKRVHNWLNHILGAEDNDYTRAVGLKFLVAAVKRIFEPGCKFDYILVLEGKQGTLKSTTFEILASKEWYCDPSIDVTNKDVVGYMFGKWIVELPEMETHRRTETTAMKSFLSRNTDRCRMPYARVTIDFPRQCVFAGTINPENDEDIGWLKDSTGNRRYWPVPVGRTHTPELEKLRLVRDQLWAEAFMLYKQKVTVYLDDHSINAMAIEEQRKRMGRDSWTETLEVYVKTRAAHKIVLSFNDIYVDGLGGNMLNSSRREQVRVSAIMQQLGWEKGVFHDSVTREPFRGYKRPFKAMEELT